MRLHSTWRLASLLSVALLLSGSDVCMLFTCPALDAQGVAHSAAHDACGGCSAAPGQHGDGRAGDCPLPCGISVTLTTAPELSSPHAHGTAAPPADLHEPMADLAASAIRARLVPPGPSHAPPFAPPPGATGIRAPPIA